MRIQKLLLIIVLCFGGNKMFAQSLSVSVGWYQIINRADGPEVSFFQRSTLHQKVFASMELYFSEFYNSNKNYRFGLRLQGVKIHSSPVYPSEVNFASRDGVDYGLFSFLLNYQRKIVYVENNFVVLNVAPGITFFSTDIVNYRESGFGNLPDAKFSVTSGLDYIYRFNEQLALKLGGKFTFVFSENSDIYPFSSGPSIEIGLVFGKL